jgi:dolichol-phosphate mannosyltransferase
VSVVVPAYHEEEAITACLDRILEAVASPCEVLVVCDDPEDPTVPWVEKYSREDPRVALALNTLGPGPANALRFGFGVARADVVVVTMADGSDDPSQIDELVGLVEGGAVIAAASRYAPGGRQVDGPWLKSRLSRAAGLSLARLARVGTRDATNSFKAYRRSFVEQVGVDSSAGFEVGIELVAKARRLRLPVAEVPTVWVDRTSGMSRFRLARWLPRYLRWYLFAFGPPLNARSLPRRVRR